MFEVDDDEDQASGQDAEILAAARGTAAPAPPRVQSPTSTDTTPWYSKAYKALTTTPEFIQNYIDEKANELNASATGKDPILDAVKGFTAGAMSGATKAFGNPAGIASAAAGFPEEGALFSAARTAAAIPQVVEGVHKMADSHGLADTAIGAGQTGLGVLQGILGLREGLSVPETPPVSGTINGADVANRLPAGEQGVTDFHAPTPVTPTAPEDLPPTSWERTLDLLGRQPAEQRSFPQSLNTLPEGTGIKAPTPDELPDLRQPPAPADEPGFPASLNAAPSSAPPSASAVLELLNPDEASTVVNGSGAPGGGSYEEFQRTKEMQRNGQNFVVYDRGGNKRVLGNAAGLQDYKAQPGETFGVESPSGFSVFDDNGGRVPRGASESASGQGENQPSAGPVSGETGPTPIHDLDELGDTSAGEPVHPAIQALHDYLTPKWEAALQAQEGDDIPFTVDPRESIQDLNDRVMHSDPASLMGAERKARAAALADETGASTGAVLSHVAGAGVGALAGAEDQREAHGNPWVGAAVGGAAGAAIPTLWTNPKLAQGLRYLNLLAGPGTILRKTMGDIGGAGRAMFDAAASGDLAKAGRIGKNFFSTRTVSDLINNVKNNTTQVPTTGTFGPNPSGPLGWTRRVYGGLTDAAHAAYARVGLSPEEAAHYTYTGKPTSALAQSLIDLGNKGGGVMDALLPFTRVAANIGEQGVKSVGGDFLPLLAKVRAGQAVSPSEWAAAGVKTIPGAAAVYAGKRAADQEAATGKLTAPPSLLESAGEGLATPYNIPFQVAKTAEKGLISAARARSGGEAPLDVVSDAAYDTLMPLAKEALRPSELLTQALPSSGLATVSRLLGQEPRSFDTSHSELGKTISNIPFANASLPKSRTYKPAPRPLTASDDATILAAIRH